MLDSKNPYLSVNKKYFVLLEHYDSTKRATIWIKLYLSLFDDIEFCMLQDSVKWHFVGLLMFSVKVDNRIPNNSQFIANKISATEKLDLDFLLEKGFLVPYEESKKLSASKLDSSSASTDKNRSKKQEKIKSKKRRRQLSFVRLKFAGNADTSIYQT